MTHIKVYVPKDAANYDDAADYVRHALSGYWGGWTEYDGRGGWVNPQGETVTEPVTVFESYADMDGEARPLAEGVAERVLEKTDETAVMVAVDGEKILAAE